MVNDYVWLVVQMTHLFLFCIPSDGEAGFEVAAVAIVVAVQVVEHNFERGLASTEQALRNQRSARSRTPLLEIP